jgi:ABC-type transport system involved in multi-copper enzyme maturation permease subunit
LRAAGFFAAGFFGAVVFAVSLFAAAFFETGALVAWAFAVAFRGAGFLATGFFVALAFAGVFAALPAWRAAGLEAACVLLLAIACDSVTGGLRATPERGLLTEGTGPGQARDAILPAKPEA